MALAAEQAGCSPLRWGRSHATSLRSVATSRLSPANDPRFEFGRNWQSFVRDGIDEGSIASAVASLRRLLVVEDLRGCTFLDLGCGSGLSSLAALTLGAVGVVAFDVDADAVAASIELRRRAGIDSARWRVVQGSILDEDFLATLEPADVVYAWGSLHHSGSLWQAIDNAVRLLRPSAALAISIYNEVASVVGGSAQWWRIKRFYNRAPPTVRLLMEYAYLAQRAARDLGVGRNPLLRARERARGMSYRHDVRDWLGGFPYEYASAGAVFNHIHTKHGLELVYLNTGDGHVCNELTFRRRSGDGESTIASAR